MNDFQYFSLNKPTDWLKGSLHNLEVGEDGIRLMQTHKYGVRTVLDLKEVIPNSLVQDCAMAMNGKVFLLDDHTNVWSYDSFNKHAELLFRDGHELFTPHAAIAAVADVLVFADAMGSYPIAAYSINNAQALWSLSAWGNIPIIPCSIISDSREYVYVLAICEDTHQHLIVLKIHRTGGITGFFLHDLLLTDYSLPREIALQWQMTTSKDGHLYLLHTDTNQVLHLSPDSILLTQFELNTTEPLSGFAMDTHGQLYVGSGRELERHGEDNRFIQKLDQDGVWLNNVSAFRGKVQKIMIDPRNTLVVFEKEENSITILASELKTQEMTGTGLLEGIFLSTALDCTETETIWHKIELVADIPESTQIRISYYASDHQHMQWNGMPVTRDEFLSNPDIPIEQKLNHWRSLEPTPITNPQDALLFHATGRYIWLKIDFTGNEGHSPKLSSLRVYYPRMTLLSYLPAIYAEEDKETGFLERFLALFGTFFQDMDQQIAGIAKYLDPESVSGDYLKWLASWVGIASDDHWTDAQLRNLIAAAPELYRKRGTREGIERMIEIYVGERPLIIEYFQLHQIRSNSDFSSIVNELYTMNPYTFCVLMKAERIESEKQRSIVERLINEQKPAFTEGKLILLQPWLYMDMHTYLGINTYLSEPTLLRLDNSSSIPNNSTLIDVDMDNRLDTHTRLGLDSEIE
ncbi:MAG: phage tail protein [Paenibacillaceae bacterium]